MTGLKIILLAIVLLSITFLCSGCVVFVRRLFYKPDAKKMQYITDTSGRIVIYHGVNISNYSKHSGAPGYHNRGRAAHPWCEREDLNRLPKWGFNLVRYLLFWEAIEPQDQQFDEEYLTIAYNRVKYLERLGIHVILDIHQDLYAQKFSGNGFPEWSINDEGKEFTLREPWNKNYFEPAVQASYKNFWESGSLRGRYVQMLEHVIARFEDLPHIIGIDVMNEPIPKFPILRFERKILTKFYYEIQDMMRRTGTRFKMFFEPWMSTSTGIPTNLRFRADNGVYYPHYYDFFCEQKKPYKSFNRWVMRRGMEIKVREAQQFNAPIVYGEFSFPREAKDNLKALKDFLELADRHSIGWTYWSYDLAPYNSRSFIDADRQPNEVLAVLMRIYPQRIAGTQLKYSFKKDVFVLEYIASAPGPTEIFIPKDWDVVVETDGQYIREGHKLLYHNTSAGKHRIVIRVLCREN